MFDIIVYIVSILLALLVGYRCAKATRRTDSTVGDSTPAVDRSKTISEAAAESVERVAESNAGIESRIDESLDTISKAIEVNKKMAGLLRSGNRDSIDK